MSNIPTEPGWYWAKVRNLSDQFSPVKLDAVMRPSTTFNAAIASLIS